MQAHEEHAGHDLCIGLGLDGFERRPDGVLRGVHRAGHHAVGEAVVHHHCAEVTHVGHRVAGHFLRDTLVPAQIVIGLRKLLAQFGIQRIDDVDDTVQVQTEFIDFRADFIRVAQQRDFRDIAQHQYFRREQDARFGAFRQHDMPALGTRLADEFVFEHQRRHPGRLRRADALQQLIRVNAALGDTQRNRKLAFVSRVQTRGNFTHHHRGFERIGGHAQHRNRHVAEAIDQPHDLPRGLLVTGQQQSGDLRIHARGK